MLTLLGHLGIVGTRGMLTKREHGTSLGSRVVDRRYGGARARVRSSDAEVCAGLEIDRAAIAIFDARARVTFRPSESPQDRWPTRSVAARLVRSIHVVRVVRKPDTPGSPGMAPVKRRGSPGRRA